MSDFENGVAASNGYERERRLPVSKGSAACDYTLPDYLGDVRKILGSEAEVIPTDKYSSGGEVSFLYTVQYRVTYLDKDGVMTEAAFSSEYEHNERVGDGFIDACGATRVENLAIRLGGPRKICAKASLATEVTVKESCPMPHTSIQDGAECDIIPIKIHTAEYLSSPEREYAEQLAKLEGISCEEVEVVKCKVTPHVEVCKRGEEGIEVKGSVAAAAILRIGDDVMRVEKKLPFEEKIPSDVFFADGSFCRASAVVTDASVSLNNEMTDAESANCYCSVVISYTMECSARVDMNRSYDLLRDAYVPGKKNYGEYGEFDYSEYLFNTSERRKLGCEIMRPEEPMREIIECSACVKNLRWELMGEELTVWGDVAYNIVATGTEAGECIPIRHDCQIEERIRLGGAERDAAVEVCAELCDVSASFDNERIYLSCVMTLDCSATRRCKMRVMTSHTADGDTNDDGCVIVYYPAKSDTVWSIAKAHSVPTDTVVKYNPQAPKSIHEPIGLSYVVIPQN